MPEKTGPESGSSPDRDRDDLRAILDNLSREICGPLDSLRGGIDRLLDRPSRPMTEAERGQAETMLQLCDDLGRLTRDCLGSGDGPRD